VSRDGWRFYGRCCAEFFTSLRKRSLCSRVVCEKSDCGKTLQRPSRWVRRDSHRREAPRTLQCFSYLWGVASPAHAGVLSGAKIRL